MRSPNAAAGRLPACVLCDLPDGTAIADFSAGTGDFRSAGMSANQLAVNSSPEAGSQCPAGATAENPDHGQEVETLAGHRD